MHSTLRSSLLQKTKELYWTVTRAFGLGHTHERPWDQLAGEAWVLVFYPVYALVAWYLARAHIQFISVPCLQLERIGHFALDIDCYLKRNLLAGNKVRAVLLCPKNCKPNMSLLRHWSSHLHIVRNPIAIWLFRPLSHFSGLATPLLDLAMTGWQAWDPKHPFEARMGAAPTYQIQERWNGREPLLRLSAADIARGEAELRALGIPDGSWFVCVHSREGGYSPTDEWTHSYRNSSVDDYREAMKTIVARGGWCVRVGDTSMRPLAPMSGVIDYALSSSKSDWMDIFLCARCRFFLGNTSGLFCVAGIFGRPSALANLTPLASAYSPFPNDISIPKTMMNAAGKLMTWPETFAGEAAHLRLAPEFRDRKLTPINNTPQEISDLASEMMDKLEGRTAPEEEDELQRRFRSLLQPQHYCFYATSQISYAFLRRHQELLNEDSIGA